MRRGAQVRRGRSLAVILTMMLIATLVSPIAAVADEHDEGDEPSVLVFSATAGFRHASIPAGVSAVEDLGVEYGFEVDATEDASQFTDENLAQYDAVVWLSTTGSVLDSQQQAAFESYIQNGGGYVGIHSASDTHYDWAWYGGLVGAYFDGHPPGTQTADVWVTDQAHPSTEMLPGTWERHDEWYDFHINPRGDVHVLATLDETSYEDQVDPAGQMGSDHPIAWCQPYDGGRSWYTAGGHTTESFSEELFLEHMAGGILWAAGEVEGDCGGTVWDNYDKVVLDDATSSPMMLEVAPDGRVFYIERDGRVQIIDPDTNETTLAANLDVYTGQENGLLGITLDPDFADNDRVWLFYSPPNSVVGDEPYNAVSNFVMDGDSLDLDSEQVVLEIPHQRQECCHSAGDLEFGPDGELFISTGDDTNPFQSDAYAPIDEREGREAFDAQRTSANTNDLRGKLLRIVPTEDGSDYTIPEGNLFEEGTQDTLPEIYAMGLRNPFRFSVDQTTGVAYLADYGPDAGQPNPDRGPQNHVTWHIIDEAANIGWPYCIGPNRAYIDYDFETGESGEPFDCEGGPINDSPNNTGLTQTPPVQPATVFYNYSAPPEFPMLAGGAPMGGPRYEFDAELDSEVKWPASFDGSVVFGEWGANQIFDFNLNDDASDVTQITRMLPDMQFLRPMDFDFGPHDGALYMIEWGSGFGGNNTNSQVIRLEYTGVEDPDRPQVTVTADPTSGDAPLDVDFTAEATSPVGDDIVSYTWDFDDGDATADGADATHTYESPGVYRPTLSATDSEGRTGHASVRIDVEGDEPPPSGDLVCIGELDEVLFTSDFDDGTTDGWVSASGTEQVNASDALALSGDYSLLTTARNQFYMGPERDVSDVVEPGGTYELSVWLRLPDGAGTADLDIISIVDDDGVDFDNLGGVTVDDEDWTELTATWTLPDSFTSAAVKVEGLPANQDFHLDDFSVTGYGQGERPERHSDEFEGNQLDGCRWDRVVRYDPETLQVTGGQLLIETPPGDIYQTPNDPVTNLVLQTQPDGDWTVETRLEEELAGGFSQAGLMVHLDDDNYVKFDVIADDGQSEVNRIELRSEVDGQIVGPQENLDVPDNDGEWWLRLTKEGDDFSGQLSTDGEDWLDFPATVTNEAAAEDGGVGVFTLGVNGPLTTVAFDHFRVDGEEIVTPPPPPPPPSTSGDLVCGELSDAFWGDTLDTDRWSRIVREDAGAYSVGAGTLTVAGAEADIYGTSANDAPNLILQPIPDPAGAWEATAQVTVEAYQAWQQAGLIVYGDDDNYAKMVLQGRDESGPDPDTRIFQFIREEGGNPNEVGDSNTDPLGADYPDTVWVRFTSDGTDLNASYSADGIDFTEMPQTKQMAGMEDPHIGLFAVNPGPGPVIDADFHSFQLTPDPTAVRPELHSDEFDGDELDGCRWDRVVRYNPDTVEMTGGQLLIESSPGDIYQDQDGQPENFILQTQPAGSGWTVETSLTEELVTGFSQAGLMVHLDDDNYVKFNVIADANQTGVNRIELRSEVDGQIVGPEPNIEAPANEGEWRLRLTRDGDSFSGQVTADGGATWLTTDASVSNPAVAADGGVGIFALANQDDPTTVAFDYFRVTDEDAMPVAPSVEVTLDPAEPDGEAGWYVSPVSISLSSDDDATLEWRFSGDDDWIEWTEAVTLSSDGVYDLEARAVGEGGTSEIAEATVALDQTPPETTATVDGTQEGDAFVDEAIVTLSAVDELSGVAETHIREQGDEDFDVSDSPVAYTAEGSYTIEFRSADLAGNVEDWQSVTFEVVDDTGVVEPPPSDVCARHQGGATFPDAPGSGHRFFIDCLAELGIVQGYTDGTYGPRDDVSRGQLASFVVRAIELATGESMGAGGELFPDVGVNSTHGQAIYKLRNAGVIRGYEDGTFRPRTSVSRDQTARYVVNALELVLGEELDRSGASFPDVAAGSQYASDIDALVTAGVITGFTDGRFGPREPVTRAQMTRFIGNALEVLADEGAYSGP